MTTKTDRKADDRDAKVIDFEVALALRDLARTQAGLAGDVSEAIRWLQRYGGIEWRRQIDE